MDDSKSFEFIDILRSCRQVRLVTDNRLLGMSKQKSQIRAILLVSYGQAMTTVSSIKDGIGAISDSTSLGLRRECLSGYTYNEYDEEEEEKRDEEDEYCISEESIHVDNNFLTDLTDRLLSAFALKINKCYLRYPL